MLKMFNVDSIEVLKFLTSIRLGLSHFADRKFWAQFEE